MDCVAGETMREDNGPRFTCEELAALWEEQVHTVTRQWGPNLDQGLQAHSLAEQPPVRHSQGQGTLFQTASCVGLVTNLQIPSEVAAGEAGFVPRVLAGLVSCVHSSYLVRCIRTAYAPSLLQIFLVHVFSLLGR